MVIVVFGGNVRSVVANRGDLIRSWARLGHEVHVIVPRNDWNSSIESLPVQWTTIFLQRTGVSLAADLRSVAEVRAVVRRLEPDIVFSYNAKPVIYGSIAAAIERVSGIYSLITGLGYARSPKNAKQKMAARVQEHLYRLALKYNTAVFFQNPDDEQYFSRKRLLSSSVPSVVVNGSGVNLEQFPLTLPIPTDPVVFVFVARLLVSKGVLEFVEAARRLHSTGAKFVVIGPYDPNLPDAVPRQFMEQLERGEYVTWLGGVDDVRSYIAQASVFVLPSSYGEGTPRAILEALSMGRAVITTDAPGCRETVVHGQNGFLVPTKDVDALVDAMRKFIEDRGLIHVMGLASRRLAEKKYDVRLVNEVISRTMGLV